MSQSKTPRWSYKAGAKGENRVRVFERASGALYLEYYDEAGKRIRHALGHRDRARAVKQAEKLATDFAVDLPGEITLGQLFDKWVGDRTPDVGKREQVEHQRCRELFCRFFGSGRKAKSIKRSDWDRFVRQRTTGAIDARGQAVPDLERNPVGPTPAQHDLALLRAALNWAVSEDLLDTNPTDRYPLPREPSPHRPRVSPGRYQAMRRAAGRIGWRFELAFVLAYETGHRIGAIQHLRWSDIDLTGRTVRWRAEHDKRRREHVTPLTDTAVTQLRKARGESRGLGEAWVLPSVQDPSKPISYWTLNDWWRACEKLAGLEHVTGLGFHGLRRTFADQVQGAPRKAAAALGGWAGPEVMENVYQRASLEAQRKVLDNRHQ